MAVVKLSDGKFLENFSQQCKVNGLDVTTSEAEWFVKVLCMGMTNFLKTVKNQTTPMALMVNDLKGNMLLGAYVAFIPAENSEEVAAGSWNYVWTFNREDIPAEAQLYALTDNSVVQVVSETGYNMVRMAFSSPTFVNKLAIDFANLLIDTLDQNAPATEGEEWAIELDGYFNASVAVEDGKKIFAVEPIGELKVKIKDDAANEVA